jgi:hypothetical protein
LRRICLHDVGPEPSDTPEKSGGWGNISLVWGVVNMLI